MEEDKTTFKCGDIVQLKSGGPLMTVKSVTLNWDYNLIFCNGFSSCGHAFECNLKDIQLIKIKA